jgi:hypothetical protein
MAELPSCRRLTDLVGGDTASQNEMMAHNNVPGLAHAQTALPVARTLRNEVPSGASDGLSAPQGGGGAEGTKLLLDRLPFKEIWAVDFEFDAKSGENPEPVCLVAWEMRSGRKVRLWRDEFSVAPPYPTGADVLFVAYYASAEIGCHLALGWPVPERVLDLFTEFRNHTNGIPMASGASLLGALAHYGLDSIGAVEKDEMRALILGGGPWTGAERAAILNYCEGDVAALARLLLAMLPHVVGGHASP